MPIGAILHTFAKKRLLMTYFDYTTNHDFYTAIKELLLEKGKKVTLNRGDALSHSGEMAQQLGILTSGALKYSYLSTNGTERIVSFAFTGDLVANYSSMRNNFPSMLDIVAIESSVVYRLPLERIDRMIGIEMRARIGEVVAYNALRCAIDNMCKSAEERYMELIHRFPDIHNRMTNRMIAKYLGITPESLSRMRKRLLTKP